MITKIKPGNETFSWVIYRGMTWARDFQALDENSSPRDLTDAAIRLLIAPSWRAPALLEATIGAGITVTDAATGAFAVLLTPIQTAGIEAGGLVLDIAITAADDLKLLHVRVKGEVKDTVDSAQGDAVVAAGADGLAELVDEAPELIDAVAATEAILISDPARAPNRRNKRKLKPLLDAKADAEGTAAALALKAPLSSPALTGAPTSPTPLTSDNSTRIATTAMVKSALAELVASSPAALDTLNELAAALGNDADFAATMAAALAAKQDATLQSGWAGANSKARSVVQLFGERSRPITAWKTAGGDLQTATVDALASGEVDLFAPAGAEVTAEQSLLVPARTKLLGRPGAKIIASGANLNALTATGDDVHLEGFEIVCCGSASSSYNGAGVYAAGRARLTLRKLLVRNHRGAALSLNACVDSEITRNLFLSAANVAPTTYSQNADIALWNACQNNVVRHNRCFGAASLGIAIQHVEANIARAVLRNLIESNYIRDCLGYGVMIYQLAPNQWTSSPSPAYTVGGCVTAPTYDFRIYQLAVKGAGSPANEPSHSSGTVAYGDGYSWTFIGETKGAFEGNRIRGNLIWNIVGSLENDALAPGEKQYGSAVYAQWADDTEISGNMIYDCCQQTNVDYLAAAGIGWINSGRGKIENNVIRRSGYMGIKANNSERKGQLDILKLANNDIDVPIKEGIKVIGIPRCHSIANTVRYAGFASKTWTSGQIYAVGDRVLADGGRAYKCSISPGTAVANTPSGTTATQAMADGYTWLYDSVSGIVVQGVTGQTTIFDSEGDVVRGGSSNGVSTTGSAITELAVRAGTVEAVAGTAYNFNSTISRLTAVGNKGNNSSRGYVTAAGATVKAWSENQSDGNSSADSFAAAFPAGSHVAGSGTPEGAISAAVGAMYTRTNGGAGTTKYFKESGSGNTGWAGK